MPEQTMAERVRAVEVQVAIMAMEQRVTNEKLDDLLTLKHKGIGAFWLASGLMGTGIVGFIVSMIEYFRS